MTAQGNITFEQKLLLKPITMGDKPKGGIEAIVYSNDPTDVPTDDDINQKCESEFPLGVVVRVHGKLVTLFRQTIVLKQENEYAWKCTANYGPEEPKTKDRKNTTDENDPLEDGRTEFDISFDIGTRQQLTRYGKEYVAGYNVTGQTLSSIDEPAINIRNGEPQGINIDIPFLTFTETHYIEAENVDDAYLRVMYGLVGSVNDAELRGFEEGELLLTRITGNKRNKEQWQITYAWAFQENLVGEDLNGATVTAEGWDVLWSEYAVEEDASIEGKKPVLLGYHRIRVYDKKDHSQLEGVD